MERKLREIFLDQVEAALSEDPCNESQFSLFKITSPTLKRSSLDTHHDKLFKKLRSEIHPDKHRNCNRANRLFQSLTDFYETSLEEFQSGPARKRAKTTSNYPLFFSSSKKWTYVELNRPSYRKIPTDSPIGTLVANQCMNARGSIAHGKKIQLTYCIDEKNDKRSAKEVFEAYGGYKVLSTPDEIKEELMTRGPVVSTSFLLSKAFLSSVEDRKKYFDGSLTSKVHDVLIVGWKHVATGEVWQIHPLVKKGKYVGEECFNIAFGQYGIDSVCIAPKNTFENESWENGPYFEKDIPQDLETWYSWRGMNFSIDSKQLEELTEAVGGDLIAAASLKKKFTLQDSRKKAHSRSCFLTKVIHEKNKSKCWRISATFV